MTGIFDLLHVEHVRFLEAAKKLGDKLMVGIESDARVKRLKGQSRPVMSESDREEMLKSLSCVDEVFILPEKFDTNEEYAQVMRKIQPDFYAVSDQSPYMGTKIQICQEVGVQLRLVRPHNPEYSTSQLIKKICI